MVAVPLRHWRQSSGSRVAPRTASGSVTAEAPRLFFVRGARRCTGRVAAHDPALVGAVPRTGAIAKDDDGVFRSAPVRLLPFWRNRCRGVGHLGRCRGAVLALPHVRAPLAADAGRAQGLRTPRWSGGSAPSDPRRPAHPVDRVAAVLRGSVPAAVGRLRATEPSSRRAGRGAPILLPCSPSGNPSS